MMSRFRQVGQVGRRQVEPGWLFRQVARLASPGLRQGGFDYPVVISWYLCLLIHVVLLRLKLEVASNERRTNYLAPT